MRFHVIEWTDEARSLTQAMSGTAGDRLVIQARDWPALRGVVVVATALTEGGTFAWDIRDAGVIDEEAPDGCGCGSSDPRGVAPALAALLLLLRRRRNKTVPRWQRGAAAW
jgi:MYXO-CTERM domain-containing protein